MGFLASRRATGCLAPWFMIGMLMAAISLADEAGAGPSAAPTHSEYEIESAMLYNFTKFVVWPGSALGAAGATVVAGVWGDDRMIPVLQAALRNKTICGHPVVVRRIDSSADAISCAVLFVGGSDRKEIGRILQSLGRSPVLTVGHRVQFSRMGGVIAFIRDGNRIRFEINVDAADRAGLEVSSKLLRLGAVWREAPPQARN